MVVVDEADEERLQLLDDFKLRISRVRACFPLGTELHRLHSTMETEFMIPTGAIVRMTDEQITRRLSLLTAFQTKMWGEWLERLKDLPRGTVVRPDWMNPDRVRGGARPRDGDIIGALLGQGR